MNKLLGAVVALLPATATVAAQDMSQVLTRPAPPPREALDRLNLKLGWRSTVPMDGARDGIYSFQMAGKQVLVQTRSGLIAALDRDTGQTLWRNRVGSPYQPSHALAYNSRSVFTAHGAWIYALDRNAGQLQWQYNLPNAVSAGPAADDDQIYLSLGSGGFSVFRLPEVSRRKLSPTGRETNKNFLPKNDAPVVRPSNFYGGSSGTTPGVGPLSSALTALRAAGTGEPPGFQFDFRAGIGLELPPLVTAIELVWAGANGTVLVVPKRTDLTGAPYRFVTDGPISVQPGQFGEYAYVGSHDGNVYALHTPSGRTLWRFTGGKPITRRPAVTNEDVYIAPEGGGLARVDRATGQTVWRTAAAHRFLAANAKFVYAADRNGRLLVLDKARGTPLSTFDGSRDFVVPISNEQTDRVFLAAHNGLVVCLHDREYETPLVIKDDEEKLLAPPAGPNDKQPGKPDGKLPEKPDGPGDGMEKEKKLP